MSAKTTRTAAALLSELLLGPVVRRDFIDEHKVGHNTATEALAVLRRSGVRVDSLGAGGSVYSLRYPEHTRATLATALRLNMGDLIEAGGIAPALGVGLLIDAGALGS